MGVGSLLTEGEVESLKEKKKTWTQWKPNSFLLAICFTQSWPAVYFRTNVIGLWRTVWFWPMDAHPSQVLVACKDKTCVHHLLCPGYLCLYTESYYSTSPSLREALRSEGILQFRQSHCSLYWLIAVPTVNADGNVLLTVTKARLWQPQRLTSCLDYAAVCFFRNTPIILYSAVISSKKVRFFCFNTSWFLLQLFAVILGKKKTSEATGSSSTLNRWETSNFPG